MSDGSSMWGGPAAAAHAQAGCNADDGVGLGVGGSTAAVHGWDSNERGSGGFAVRIAERSRMGRPNEHKPVCRGWHWCG